MFTPYLDSIPLRRMPRRSRYFRAETGTLRRARPLRFERPPADLAYLRRLRKKVERLRGSGETLTNLQLVRFIGDVSKAVEICCSFIRVHQAPGQRIVNDVLEEMLLLRDAWMLLQGKGKEAPGKVTR